MPTFEWNKREPGTWLTPHFCFLVSTESTSVSASGLMLAQHYFRRTAIWNELAEDGCVRSPQDHAQDWWFTGGLMGLSISAASLAVSYSRKRTQSKINKRKKHMGQSPKETRLRLSRVLSWRSLTGRASFPQHWAVTRVECCLPGKLSSDPVPRVLPGAGHTDTLCLARTKLHPPRRQSGAPYKPHCLCKPCRYNEPCWSVREWWVDAWNPNSQTAAKGQPGKEAFLRRAVSGPLCWLFPVQWHGLKLHVEQAFDFIIIWWQNNGRREDLRPKFWEEI